jgi:hypothetical protein
VLLKRAAVWPLSSDPDFSSVSLLLHMDGTNGSTTFTDSSSNALTLTANGNAQISTAQSKFGGASGLFDGTVDNLTVSNAVLNIASSGNYTWEGWFYATSTGGYKCIINNDFSFSATPRLYLKDSNLLGYIDSNDRISHQTTVTTNTWHHFAMVRASNVTHVYLNGVQSSTSYTYSSASNNDMRIGSDSGGSGQDFAGYLDDIRITKGVARYTANFTPPTAAFFDA